MTFLICARGPTVRSKRNGRHRAEKPGGGRINRAIRFGTRGNVRDFVRVRARRSFRRREAERPFLVSRRRDVEKNRSRRQFHGIPRRRRRRRACRRYPEDKIN